MGIAAQSHCDSDKRLAQKPAVIQGDARGSGHDAKCDPYSTTTQARLQDSSMAHSLLTDNLIIMVTKQPAPQLVKDACGGSDRSGS